MRGRDRRKRAWHFGALLMLLGTCVSTGCETPPGAKSAGKPAARPKASTPEARQTTDFDAGQVQTFDDITAIYRYYMEPPWLRNSEGRVVGFKATLVFYSAQQGSGVFVPGTIMVWLYEIERKPRGKAERKFVHGWEFSEEQAMGFRLRTPSPLGYRYGFMLAWPPELDLSGKQVEVVFGYQRQDGTILDEPGKRFEVPAMEGGGGERRVPVPPSQQKAGRSQGPLPPSAMEPGQRSPARAEPAEPEQPVTRPRREPPAEEPAEPSP